MLGNKLQSAVRSADKEFGVLAFSTATAGAVTLLWPCIWGLTC